MRLFSKKPKYTLKDEIFTASDHMRKLLHSFDYRADYSMASLKDTDSFLRERRNHLTDNDKFLIGSYVGETVIRLMGGEWHIDKTDENWKINATVVTAHGIIFRPMQKVEKRCCEEDGESLYDYVEKAKEAGE